MDSLHPSLKYGAILCLVIVRGVKYGLLNVVTVHRIVKCDLAEVTRRSER